MELACKNTKKSKRSYNGKIETEESVDKEGHGPSVGEAVQRVAEMGEQGAERRGRQPDGPQHQSRGREGVRRFSCLRITLQPWLYTITTYYVSAAAR